MLREVFKKFDKNGEGWLTLNELQEGISTVEGVDLSKEDIANAMMVIDSNQNGLVDYTEFIAAFLQSHNYLKHNHLKSAFSYFDKDNNGVISPEELKECLQYEDLTLPDNLINSLIKEADTNNDGLIDYKEFIKMMRSNSEYASTSSDLLK